eukprot:scaffold16111_cov172-Amphora_coffeaeformis.AAC.9
MMSTKAPSDSSKSRKSSKAPSSGSKKGHTEKQRYHMKNSEGKGPTGKSSSGASYNKGSKGSSGSSSYKGKGNSTMAPRMKQMMYHVRSSPSTKGKGGKGKGNVPSKGIGTGPPLGAPTDAPSGPLDQSSIFPRSPPVVLPGWRGPAAVAWGDPHVVTFDRLAYDCQGQGDFVFAKALDESLEVQGRFMSSSTYPEISITTALAAFVQGIGKVEIYTLSEGSVESSVVGTCPLNIYISGKLIDLTSRFSSDDLRVDKFDDKVDIYFGDSSLVMTVISIPWLENDCLLNAFIGIPESLPVLGLLGGTRNGIVDDDWAVTASSFLDLPATEEGLLGEEAYNYCTQQWCVRDSTNSLFTIDEGLVTKKSCDLPFPGVIDAPSAPGNIFQICGKDNHACLIDGIVGGTDGAQGAAEVAAQLEELDKRTGTQLTDSPSTQPSSSPADAPSISPSSTSTLLPSATPSGYPSTNPVAGSTDFYVVGQAIIEVDPPPPNEDVPNGTGCTFSVNVAINDSCDTR